jgi:hypothetical protein
MSRQRIEVEIEPVTGEEREAARSQELSQGVDEHMRRVLRAGAEIEHGQKLGAGVDGQPQKDAPGNRCAAVFAVHPTARAGAGGCEMRVLVQELRVLPSAGQPRGDGRLPVAEDPFRSRRIQPFGQRREHHCDLVRGGFQTIQGRVASSTERDATSRASKGLDALGTAMFAISDQRVDVSVCDPAVRALPVRTGETLSGYAFGGSPSAFDLAPGAHRQRRWPCTRRGSGGVTTGGAIVWGAWLEEAVERSALACCQLGRAMMEPAKETQPSEREHEDTQEQKKEHVMRQKDPHDVKFEGWEAEKIQ